MCACVTCAKIDLDGIRERHRTIARTARKSSPAKSTLLITSGESPTHVYTHTYPPKTHTQTSTVHPKRIHNIKRRARFTNGVCTLHKRRTTPKCLCVCPLWRYVCLFVCLFVVQNDNKRWCIRALHISSCCCYFSFIIRLPLTTAPIRDRREESACGRQCTQMNKEKEKHFPFHTPFTNLPFLHSYYCVTLRPEEPT